MQTFRIMWRRRTMRRNGWAATMKSCSGFSRRVPICHLPLLPSTEPSSPALISLLTLTLRVLGPPHTPVLLAPVCSLTRWHLRHQGRPLSEAHQQHARPLPGSQTPTLYPDELFYLIPTVWFVSENQTSKMRSINMKELMMLMLMLMMCCQRCLVCVEAGPFLCITLTLKHAVGLQHKCL